MDEQLNIIMIIIKQLAYRQCSKIYKITNIYSEHKGNLKVTAIYFLYGMCLINMPI